MKIKFQLKKIAVCICLMICLLFTGVVNTLAGESGDSAIKVTEQDSKAPGIHVYTLPAGPDGFEEGQIWLYVEMIGKNQKPYREDDWNIVTTLTHSGSTKSDDSEEGEEITDTETESEEESTDSVKPYSIEMKESSLGFYTKSLKIVNPLTDKWTVAISITSGDGTKIAEYENELTETVLLWPKLKYDQWERTYASNEAFEVENHAIVADWEDMGLFKRLFTYDIEYSSEHISVEEYAGDSIIYNVTVDAPVEETITVTFKDLAENTNAYPFDIVIVKNKHPMALWIGLAVGVFLLLFAAFMFISLKKKNKYTGDDYSEEVDSGKGTGGGKTSTKSYLARFQEICEEYEKNVKRYRDEVNSRDIQKNIYHALLNENAELKKQKKEGRPYTPEKTDKEMEAHIHEVRDELDRLEDGGTDAELERIKNEVREIQQAAIDRRQEKEQLEETIRKFRILLADSKPLPRSVMLTIQLSGKTLDRLIYQKNEVGGDIDEKKLFHKTISCDDAYPCLKGLRITADPQSESGIMITLPDSVTMKNGNPVGRCSVDKADKFDYLLQIDEQKQGILRIQVD